MSKTRIRFSLSTSDVNWAIKELERYKNNLDKELNEKTELFRERIAERIASLAQSGFNGAIVDDLLEESGGARQAEVTVSWKHGGNATVVIAKGADAVWVEFGAGVHHNGSAGSSPHPNGAELGFTIGGFGENGKRDIWGYYENGVKAKENLRLTHGTPAVMPMYNAVKTVCGEIGAIAKEVYGK